MTPSPILKALSTIRASGTRALLMGGQACVLYGAAEFSRDTDLVVFSDDDNLRRLSAAVAALDAEEEPLRRALREEEDRERTADRLYWEPLRRELKQLRHARRG